MKKDSMCLFVLRPLEGHRRFFCAKLLIQSALFFFVVFHGATTAYGNSQKSEISCRTDLFKKNDSLQRTFRQATESLRRKNTLKLAFIRKGLPQEVSESLASMLAGSDRGFWVNRINYLGKFGVSIKNLDKYHFWATKRVDSVSLDLLSQIPKGEGLYQFEYSLIDRGLVGSGSEKDLIQSFAANFVPSSINNFSPRIEANGIPSDGHLFSMSLQSREMEQYFPSGFPMTLHHPNAFAFIRFYLEKRNIYITEIQSDVYGRITDSQMKSRYRHWSKILLMAFEKYLLDLSTKSSIAIENVYFSGEKYQIERWQEGGLKTDLVRILYRDLPKTMGYKKADISFAKEAVVNSGKAHVVPWGQGSKLTIDELRSIEGRSGILRKQFKSLIKSGVENVNQTQLQIALSSIEELKLTPPLHPFVHVPLSSREVRKLYQTFYADFVNSSHGATYDNFTDVGFRNILAKKHFNETISNDSRLSSLEFSAIVPFGVETDLRLETSVDFFTLFSLLTPEEGSGSESLQLDSYFLADYMRNIFQKKLQYSHSLDPLKNYENLREQLKKNNISIDELQENFNDSYLSLLGLVSGIKGNISHSFSFDSLQFDGSVVQAPILPGFKYNRDGWHDKTDQYLKKQYQISSLQNFFLSQKLWQLLKVKQSEEESLRLTISSFRDDRDRFMDLMNTKYPIVNDLSNLSELDSWSIYEYFSREIHNDNWKKVFFKYYAIGQSLGEATNEEL